MPVYVDDSRRPQGPYLLSTLLADTDKELQAIARAIGLCPSWIHTPDDGADVRAYVSPGLRARAIKHKALEITADQARAMRWHRHHHGTLGTPAAALERFNQDSERRRTTTTDRGTP